MNNDTIQIRGDVRTVIRDGENTQTRFGSNLVVTVGRQAMAKLLGGGRTGAITKFGVGTGSTAAALGDTTLTGISSKAVASVSYPATNQVQFTLQLAPSDAVGMAIRELGLFFADDTMFSRFVESGVITKNGTMTITWTWTLTF